MNGIYTYGDFVRMLVERGIVDSDVFDQLTLAEAAQQGRLVTRRGPDGGARAQWEPLAPGVELAEPVIASGRCTIGNATPGLRPNLKLVTTEA